MAGVGVSTTDRLQTQNFCLQPSTALTLTPANFKVVLILGMSRWADGTGGVFVVKNCQDAKTYSANLNLKSDTAI